MIAIINYGMGNLRSVQKGLEKVGLSAKITENAEEILAARGVILPGVGAFADAVKNLKSAGLDGVVSQVIKAGKPFLGICLGMQLLFEASEEWGLTYGLGIFPGRVKKLPGKLKVPHMGWNEVFFQKDSPLMEGIKHGSHFYFVHSYYVDTEEKELIAGVTEYGIKFPSMVIKNNIFGIQFHPEKSSALGLKVLKNFGGLVV